MHLKKLSTKLAGFTMTKNQKKLILTTVALVMTISFSLNLAFIFKINNLQEEIKGIYYNNVIEPMIILSERLEKCESKNDY
jgi:hypothetical protein